MNKEGEVRTSWFVQLGPVSMVRMEGPGISRWHLLGPRPGAPNVLSDLHPSLLSAHRFASLLVPQDLVPIKW